MRGASRGWRCDDDGWWYRRATLADVRMFIRTTQDAQRFASVRTLFDRMMEPGGIMLSIGDGCHAFMADGNVLCRNAKQKRRIDNGLAVYLRSAKS